MKVSRWFFIIGMMGLTAAQAGTDILENAGKLGKLTNEIQDKVSKGKATKKGIQEMLCKKASLFSGKISLRSLEGRLCVGTLGAFSVLACKNYSDKDGSFTDSACYRRALDSVGGGDPTASSVTMFVNGLKHDTSTVMKVVKPLICAAGPIVLDVTGVGAPAGVALGAACGLSSAVGSASAGASKALGSLEDMD